MISRLPQGFSTRCLRFTSAVAAAHARLASGWRAPPLPGGRRTLWVTMKGFRSHPSSFPGLTLTQAGRMPDAVLRACRYRGQCPAQQEGGGDLADRARGGQSASTPCSISSGRSMAGRRRAAAVRRRTAPLVADLERWLREQRAKPLALQRSRPGRSTTCSTLDRGVHPLPRRWQDLPDEQCG